MLRKLGELLMIWDSWLTQQKWNQQKKTVDLSATAMEIE